MPRAARVEAEIGARAAAARMPPFAYYYSKQGAQAPRVEQPRPPRRRRGRPPETPDESATHHNLGHQSPPGPPVPLSMSLLLAFNLRASLSRFGQSSIV